MPVSSNLLRMISDALKDDREPTNALVLAFLGHDYSGAEVGRVLKLHGLKVVQDESKGK